MPVGLGKKRGTLRLRLQNLFFSHEHNCKAPKLLIEFILGNWVQNELSEGIYLESHFSG